MIMQASAAQFAGQDLDTLLVRRTASRPDHDLLVWCPHEGPARKWTYGRFEAEVARVAAGLAGLGVAAGERVMLHLENSPELLVSLFACARLGAICVPTNAMAAGPELSYFAQLTEAVGVITQPGLAAKFAEHCLSLKWRVVTADNAGDAPEPRAGGSGMIDFDALSGDPVVARTPDPTAPLLILFTSGTTSRPKGVLWTHANALWAARLGAYQQGLRSSDIFQVFLPMFHVVGLSWSVLPMLWVGGTIVLQPRFSASRYWPVAVEQGCTVSSQVIFTQNVLAGAEVDRTHSFRQWCNANSPPGHEAYFGLKVMGAWGMTEMVAQGIVGDLWSGQPGGSIGRASPGYALRIVSDDGSDVRPGESGTLLVKGVPGVSVFKEYFADPHATAEAFDADGYFITGDVVTLLEDGNIRFSDRGKDIIKVGGEGVSAAEIERVVREVEGVAEIAVVAAADPLYGQVPVAFVIRQGPAEHDGLLEQRILQHCKASLAKYKVPHRIHFVADFPRISVGKVSKRALREWAADPVRAGA